jgi:hypothetical protein
VTIVETNHPGSQPLPRLDDVLIGILVGLLPQPQMAGRWDASKLTEIKKGFKPKPMDDGGGCMLTAYNVLDTLYGNGYGERLKNKVIARAYQKADEEIKKSPGAYKNMTREQVASKYNTSDLTYAVMREEGLAGEKVQTANKDADDAIRRLTPSEPGTYVFGLAIKGHHTVTLVVEKAADGTQKMHWLDQHTQYDPKQDRFENGRNQSLEIKDGKLGDALSNWVFHGPDTTNIYPLRPPGGKP